MSQVIKIKHSTTTGNKPTSLSVGELALNVSDGHFFFGDSSNVQNYLHLGATSASTLSITKTLVVTGQTDLHSNLVMNSNKITSLSDPTAAQDGATKAYVDSFTPSGLHYLPLSGGTVTGPLNVSGATDIFRATRIHFTDNAKAIFGDGEDLKIYHSGSHSIIQESGIGNLLLKGGAVKIMGTTTGDDCAVFTENGSVELYYDNTKRFETVSTGSEVTGTLETTGNITGATNVHVGGDVFTDQIRRATSNAQTTKMNLQANSLEFYVGDSSDEVVKILGDNVVIYKPLNVSGDTSIDGSIYLTDTRIKNLRAPIDIKDAANKAYVDQYATSGVSSVTVSGSDGIDVAGSPITTSGTIELGLSNVPNSSLANSAVSYGGVSLSLGGTDATPAFNLSDATAYPGTSTLVTTGTITTGVWNSSRLFTKQEDAGVTQGDYVTFGTEKATDVGQIYFYYNNIWTLANAETIDTSTYLLAMAMGDSSLTDGMLIRGMTGQLAYDAGDDGDPLYLSTVDGQVTSVAPTSSTNVVRVVGYALGDSPVLWFNPDNTWVELT